MKIFTTPEWESNAVADKTCHELFKKSKARSKRKNKKDGKKQMSEFKTGRIKKAKSKATTKKLEIHIKNNQNTKAVKRIRKNTFSDNASTTKIQSKEDSRSEPTKNKLQPNKMWNKSDKKATPKKSYSIKSSILKPKMNNLKPSIKLKTLHKNLSAFNNKNSKLVKNKLKKSKKQRLEPEIKDKDLNSVRFNNKPRKDDTEQMDFKTDDGQIKHQKKKVTHQTLFVGTSRKARLKRNKKLQEASASLEAQQAKLQKNRRKRLKQKLHKLSRTELPVEQTLPESNINCVIEKPKKIKAAHRFREKLKVILQQKHPTSVTAERMQKTSISLRDRMLGRLKAARFRYLNEQLYTTGGNDAMKYFQSNPDAYSAYHEGYKNQVAKWPLNPLDIIIEKIKKLPESHIIADFGCGDAILARSVPQKVHSFDLVAVNESVTACDMAHVPLKNDSVNAVVFCLSLMGTNLKDYLLEANRVLKVGGLLKIAEVESRFENIDSFIKEVQSFGFAKAGKDLSHDLFYFLDFVKRELNVKRTKLPNISLKPCLYKKR